MAKYEMQCVFSGRPCRDCPLFRGRHYYLCLSKTYRGRPAEIPEEEPRKSGDEPWYEALFPPPAEETLEADDLAELAGEIDLSFTPEGYAEERYERLAGREPVREHGRYFFQIDVWGCRARLCLVDTAGDGSFRPVDLGVPAPVLENAVFASGGALLMAGHYPMDEAVRAHVARALGRAAAAPGG